MKSPYDGLSHDKWLEKTNELIAAYPISEKQWVEVVLDCWKSIFQTTIGTAQFKIGKDISPQPQIMGFFLHELIPLELETRFPGQFARDATGYGKDVVCLTDASQSCEIKTSSHKSKIFGNRSHAQIVSGDQKKDKSGYYLAVNFSKFDGTGNIPVIRRIRFGWIDGSDWHGQKSPTGQQANLSKEVEAYKLKELYVQK